MEQLVKIKTANIFLEGGLNIPPQAKGIIVFAHGSGSSRFSPRNNFVANRLTQAGLGSLLIDLLTASEDEEYSRRFDISLLANRLIDIIGWLKKEEQTKTLSLGLFGASTGAAAALIAAAKLNTEISAIVSRGGRPDLAQAILNQVTAPTLLIVGGLDYGVIEKNQSAYQSLAGIKQLEIIPQATHLFEEEGALEQVTTLSIGWFLQYLQIENIPSSSQEVIGPRSQGSCYPEI